MLEFARPMPPATSIWLAVRLMAGLDGFDANSIRKTALFDRQNIFAWNDEHAKPSGRCPLPCLSFCVPENDLSPAARRGVDAG
jgi:hypothetical protein